MKLTKREKILLLLLFIVGGGYLYYRFVFTPEWETLTRLKAEYRQKTAILQKVQDKDNRIAELKKQIADAEKQKDSLGKGVSQPLRLPALLSELEQACSKNGVAIDHINFAGTSSAVKGRPQQSNTGSGNPPASIQDAAKNITNQSGAADSSNKGGNPSAATQQGLPTAVTVSFTFTANYENLMNLLRYYEDNTRFFLLENLDVQGDPSGKCTGKASFIAYSIVKDPEDFRYGAGTAPQRQNPFK